MLWFLLFLAIFIWAFGFKGTVKIALIAIAGWLFSTQYSAKCSKDNIPSAKEKLECNLKWMNKFFIFYI